MLNYLTVELFINYYKFQFTSTQYDDDDDDIDDDGKNASYLVGIKTDCVVVTPLFTDCQYLLHILFSLSFSHSC